MPQLHRACLHESTAVGLAAQFRGGTMKKRFEFLRGDVQSLLRLRKRQWLIAVGLILAMSGLVYAAYFQSFETDTAGWVGATRVASGTHLIMSKTGAFHAEDG